MVDPVLAAAVTNASWCDAVCRALGLPTRWASDAWTVAERSPGGYPDAVTLLREAEVAAVLKRVEDGPGCSVKDSFAALDLERSGFHVLFEATWIRRAAAAGAGSAATLDWHGVQTPADLEQWSEGHRLDVFVPALLDCDDLRFYGTGSADGPGFALNRSGGVVGASNVFAGSADLVTVWSDLIVVAARDVSRVRSCWPRARRRPPSRVDRRLRRHRAASGLDALNNRAADLPADRPQPIGAADIPCLELASHRC